MKNKKAMIQEFLMITLATIITGAGVFFFLMPSNLAVGSISGLAIVVANFIPLPISTITMIFNAGLLVIGFALIGKEFGGKTVYTSLLLPVVIGVFEKMFPTYVSMTADPFLDMLGYMFVTGVGLAMLFNRNASSGGLDIVAKLLNKHWPYKVKNYFAFFHFYLLHTGGFFYLLWTEFTSFCKCHPSAM